MSEKQTTFFAVNCAEKLESPNQCLQRNSRLAAHYTSEKWYNAYENFQSSNLYSGFEDRCSGDLTKIQL
jgi:hypothetical protein